MNGDRHVSPEEEAKQAAAALIEEAQALSRGEGVPSEGRPVEKKPLTGRRLLREEIQDTWYWLGKLHKGPNRKERRALRGKQPKTVGEAIAILKEKGKVKDGMVDTTEVMKLLIPDEAGVL